MFADVAIITALPEEFASVRRRLPDAKDHQGTETDPRLYGWVTGEVERRVGGSPYKVVLARCAHAGQIHSAMATLTTIQRWKPRFVFFVGVAGGFADQGVTLGDLVVSDVIWGYEYGKVGQAGVGRFVPRHDLVHRCDSALITSATDYATEGAWRSQVQTRDSESGIVSRRWHIGAVASGDKVVDICDSSFFEPVKSAWPKLLAIEMEGVAAAAAAQEAVSAGHIATFLMIRGISDLPSTPPSSDPSQLHGTQVRDQWKQSATDLAAVFATSFIAHGLPVSPKTAKQPTNRYERAHKVTKRSRSSASRPTISASSLERAVSNAARALIEVQHSDGGIPATRPRDASGCWTTASTLESLLLTAPTPEVREACDTAAAFLLNSQMPSGAWPLVDGTSPSTLATGHALAALLAWGAQLGEPTKHESLDLAIANGFVWLKANAITHGGWGVEPTGSDQGRDFRIASSYYALRPFLARGDSVKTNPLVRDTVLLIADLQRDDGCWPFVSGRDCRDIGCASNTSRAVDLLLRSQLRLPSDPSIARAVEAILSLRSERSWLLSVEGFYEPQSRAQNIYHNNTPCDAIGALQAARAHQSVRLEALEWLMGGQREDGTWPLQSPDPKQYLCDVVTWSTAEFLYVTAAELAMLQGRSSSKHGGHSL